LSGGLLQHLDIVVIMGFSRIKGIDVRRIKEVVEIIGVDERSDKPITNQLFRWVPAGDYFEFASDRSYVLNKIIQEKGIPEESIWDEIQRRGSILDWMKKENIRYYKDVGKIIATYYKNPEEILKKIQGMEKYGLTNI
jgi:flagellar protein FlaI